MARDSEKIRKSYKYSKVKSHLIFFKKDKKNEIEVVRVLYERMDIENKLGE
jgi:toxin ParE1/3/4